MRLQESQSLLQHVQKVLRQNSGTISQGHYFGKVIGKIISEPYAIAAMTSYIDASSIVAGAAGLSLWQAYLDIRQNQESHLRRHSQRCKLEFRHLIDKHNEKRLNKYNRKKSELKGIKIVKLQRPAPVMEYFSASLSVL